MSHRILFAEDNAAMANVVKFRLKKAGFEVTHSYNGKEAWEHAQRNEYDLVLTDHQMPLLSGIELCERLRQMEAFRTTPIIMLTAKQLELNKEVLQQQLDVSRIMAKPFSPSQLIEAIEEQLSVAAQSSV
ncbi:MAG: response regulator [Pirellulaceae bacterium]